MLDLTRIEEFEWDSGNERKNEKHGVTQQEAEQVFLHQPLLLLEDTKHGGSEPPFSRAGQELRWPSPACLVHSPWRRYQDPCDIGPAHALEGKSCV